MFKQLDLAKLWEHKSRASQWEDIQGGNWDLCVPQSTEGNWDLLSTNVDIHLSPVTHNIPYGRVCWALPCVWLGSSSYVAYLRVAFSEMLELAQSTWDRVDLRALLHRLTCVQRADVDPKRQFNIPVVSGRTSSFFSSLPALSFLLPVLLIIRMEASTFKMSEGTGEAAGCCCMSKTSQVSKFVFMQQDLTKKKKMKTCFLWVWDELENHPHSWKSGASAEPQ